LIFAADSGIIDYVALTMTLLAHGWTSNGEQ
jgi:hypothetical protein